MTSSVMRIGKGFDHAFNKFHHHDHAIHGVGLSPEHPGILRLYYLSLRCRTRSTGTSINVALVEYQQPALCRTLF